MLPTSWPSSKSDCYHPATQSLMRQVATQTSLWSLVLQKPRIYSGRCTSARTVQGKVPLLKTRLSSPTLLARGETFTSKRISCGHYCRNCAESTTTPSASSVGFGLSSVVLPRVRKKDHAPWL